MPTFAFSRSTERAYETSCGSWACGVCSRRKKAAARLAIEIGMDRAWAAGRRVRFLTFTDDTAGEMTVRDLYTSWNKLRIKLRRDRILDQYAAVVETQLRGALHLHVLATGRYVPQKTLAARAAWAGFGAITDVREVKRDLPGDDKRAAAYVAKELAGYVSKGAKELAQKTNARRRPVRFSREWGCSLRTAEEMVVAAMCEETGTARDQGPWVLLVKSPDGSLLPRGGAGLPRVIPPEPADAAGDESASTARESPAREAA